MQRLDEAAPFLLTSQSSGAPASHQSVIAYLFDSEASAQRFASTVRTAMGSCSAFQVSSLGLARGKLNVTIRSSLGKRLQAVVTAAQELVLLALRGASNISWRIK